jgi:hypothetical protein
MRLGFEELSQNALRIVHARCVGKDTFLETESGTIWTRNYFEILDTLKGNVTAKTVVMEPGGILGDQGQWVAGAPQFNYGDESVLFLAQTVTGKWRVLGWGQGNYRVLSDPATGRAVVKADLEGIRLASPVGFQYESNMASQTGKSNSLEGLEEFKTRIRTQLMRSTGR